MGAGSYTPSKKVSNSWAHPDEKTSVFELKAYVENILKRAGVKRNELTMQACEEDIYSQAMQLLTKGGKKLATFGVVSHAITKSLGIDNEVYFADINWHILRKTVAKLKVNYTELSKFPAVRRDLALLLDEKVAFSEIEKIAYDTERKLLKEVNLFDVYEGKGLAAGKKSYAVSFLLQDDNQTLNDKTIEKVMSRLVTNITGKASSQFWQRIANSG